MHDPKMIADFFVAAIVRAFDRLTMYIINVIFELDEDGKTFLAVHYGTFVESHPLNLAANSMLS